MKKAQGATEYLVLLAVVLIVALVSVALLGFFPGMASDAQLTQSKAYWQSASPISILETKSYARMTDLSQSPYIRIRNSGAYPIRITGLIGGDGGKATRFWSNMGATPVAGCSPSVGSGWYLISDYYYLAPGEEKYFSGLNNLPCDSRITMIITPGDINTIGGASSVCQNSSAAPGTLLVNGFGFEYIEYIEGQQITKRQIGAKPLMIKCEVPVPG